MAENIQPTIYIQVNIAVKGPLFLAHRLRAFAEAFREDAAVLGAECAVVELDLAALESRELEAVYGY